MSININLKLIKIKRYHRALMSRGRTTAATETELKTDDDDDKS